MEIQRLTVAALFFLIAPHHFGVRELFAAKSYRNRRAQNYFCNTFGRNGIVQEFMIRSTDYLRRTIAPAGGEGGVTVSYTVPALQRLVALRRKHHKVVVRNLWREVRLEATNQAFGRANR